MMHAKNGIDDGTEDPPVKPLFWIASARTDLRQFPDEVKQVMGFGLFQAQVGGMHVSAKPLKGFGGGGVVEIAEDHVGGTYRAVYTVSFPGAVYVLHAFQKKSKKGSKTPPRDLERIKKRLKIAEQHHKKWRAIQQKKGENP